jgi:hypothetical protein
LSQRLRLHVDDPAGPKTVTKAINLVADKYKVSKASVWRTWKRFAEATRLRPYGG